MQATLLSGLLCSNAEIKRDPETRAWKAFGSSTEAPLVVAALKYHLKRDVELARYPRVDEVAFSSAHKVMLTVHRLGASQSLAPDEKHSAEQPNFGALKFPPEARYIVCVKGAPQYVLQHCSDVMHHQPGPELCRRRPISASDRSIVTGVVDELSEQALRVIAVAYRPLNKLPVRKYDRYSVALTCICLSYSMRWAMMMSIPTRSVSCCWTT